MLPATTERVPLQTADAVNAQIRFDTQQNVERYRNAGPQAIQTRLDELNKEWDIERTLEANAATAVLVGVTLGATVDKRWYLFPGIVAGFLLQHALQGWCPPLPLFRRLGVRTASEIGHERYALKALRGDFQVVDSVNGDPESARNALRAVEA